MNAHKIIDKGAFKVRWLDPDLVTVYLGFGKMAINNLSTLEKFSLLGVISLKLTLSSIWELL